MTDVSITEISKLIEAIGIGIIALAVLLIMINVLLFILRRKARRHIDNTDLDLIGQQAVVIRALKPGKPGKVICLAEEDVKIVLDAISDQTIHHGQDVLITAIESGRLRVVPR